MVNTLQKIIDFVNLKQSKRFILNTEFANITLQTNFHQTSQVKWKDLFTSVCEYIDHIFYIEDYQPNADYYLYDEWTSGQYNVDDLVTVAGAYYQALTVNSNEPSANPEDWKKVDVIVVVDKLIGRGKKNAASYIADDYTILFNSMSGASENSIVNSYLAEWSVQEYNASTFQLVDSPKALTSFTGRTSGIEVTIKPLNYIIGTGADGHIAHILARKAELHVKDNLAIKLATPKNLPVGAIITLDSAEATGSFVSTHKTIYVNGDEEHSGIGTITY